VNESLKNKLIIILSITNVIFLLLAFFSWKNSREQSYRWSKEMYSRVEAEEARNNSIKEKAAIETKLEQLVKDIEAAKSENEQLVKSLAQEKMVNKNQGLELDKVIKIKESFEVELKKYIELSKDKTDKSKK
jgi:hypothetical protein